jgi:alkylation response protein AidB-like acyl-CoA dehydrogenase
VRLEAARSVIEDTATRLDAGEGASGALNTEGAIAKYMATEAGIAAADAAIQAHGGYGYTRPYVVEKIRRDVRITTIYEGTSEIMEMTIARDRWQHHLKSGGRYYADMAARLDGVHAGHPQVGADVAALACRALVVILDACRTGRLTRSQHVLFRLGELVAWTETAAVFATKAAAAADGSLHEKCLPRFDAAALAAMSRVFAREAAQKVALEGTRWVAGASAPGAAHVAAVTAVPTAQILAAQVGLVTDLDTVRDVLYAPFSAS